MHHSQSVKPVTSVSAPNDCRTTPTTRCINLRAPFNKGAAIVGVQGIEVRGGLAQMTLEHLGTGGVSNGLQSQLQLQTTGDIRARNASSASCREPVSVVNAPVRSRLIVKSPGWGEGRPTTAGTGEGAGLGAGWSISGRNGNATPRRLRRQLMVTWVQNIRMRYVPCDQCALRGLPVFKVNTPEESQFIQQFKRDHVTVSADQAVVREGERAELSTLYSGLAFRYKTMRDGRRQILNFLFPGDLIGLQDQLGDVSQHGVEALTTVQLCQFKRDELIADAIGMSLIHTNRSMRQLRSLGLYEIEQGWLSLPKPNTLAKLTEYFQSAMKPRPLI